MTLYQKIITPFVGFALANTRLDYDSYQIDWEASDGKRIYVALDDGDYSYSIRIWDITEERIAFTLFDITGEEGKEILCGYYHYVPFPSWKYVS